MTKVLLLLPIIVEFLQKYSNLTEAVSESKSLLKAELRAEILALSIKFICGLIFGSVIIFSLVSVGQQINLILLALENGHLTSMAFFAVLTILSAGILVYLFRTTTPKKPEQILSKPAESMTDLSKVMTSFCNGLAEGILNASEREAHKATSKSEVDNRV